ncbi:hypothetical protein KC331_g17706 [Hortaea werneckii]|uniref:Uncharacterized protein n=1 Tax=Hortaea werneckii TaxID=91943 RepID=A0A3M7ARK7_HORWE|nr:hypothetical protein KC331_g17706 [Hortaea werneckii]KAI7696499.1 hypothetical protein KC353_g17494 [Hortaea werneckii]RMY30068.1 hypothetical protein D0865_15350 [Hortaea werneckii]
MTRLTLKVTNTTAPDAQHESPLSDDDGDDGDDEETIESGSSSSSPQTDLVPQYRRRRGRFPQDADLDREDGIPIPLISARPTEEVRSLLREIEGKEKDKSDFPLDAGTKRMYTMVKRLMAQRNLVVFVLRYDEGARRCDLARFGENSGILPRYSETRLNRWELVADMLEMTILHRDIVLHYGDDYELCWSKSGVIQRLDDRLCTFMEDVLRWSKQKIVVDEKTGRLALPNKVIFREWRRRGTWETMSAKTVVPQEHLAQEREEELKAAGGEGKVKGYPLRIW